MSTKYYDLLGVSPDVSDADLKKAHRKLVLVHHPDKGGDAEKFKEINQAYEVLRDPEKRRMYDQFGEVDGGGGGMMPDMNDLFGMFAGFQQQQQQQQQQQRRADNIVHDLHVDLADMYRGKTTKIKLQRTILCRACAGSGSRSGKTHSCQRCRGSGTETHMRPIGPGMMQQIRQRCSGCEGRGVATPSSDQCPLCNGSCTASDTKIFDVHIPRGCPAQHKIVFRGETGTASPSILPGDVIIVIRQKEHPEWTRIGNHLVAHRTISLSEALTGYEGTITHLDGRVLRIAMTDRIIRPRSCLRIPHEGMDRSDGHIYIQFDVAFPETPFDPAAIATIRNVLGAPSPPTPHSENGIDVRAEMVEDIDAELKQQQHQYDRRAPPPGCVHQ
jgi:DnaJ family protein A protein 2